MNYYQAHEILERVKHGYQPPVDTINRALCLTGDIDHALHDVSPFTRLDRPSPLQGTGVGSGLPRHWQSGCGKVKKT